MNREQIIRMALEALDYEAEKSFDADAWLDIRKALREMLAQQEQEHIKALEDAVAAEREACAKVCDEQQELVGAEMCCVAMNCAAAIRARGNT